MAGTRLRNLQLSALLGAVFRYFWLCALTVKLPRFSLVATAEGDDELTVVSYVSRCNGLVWKRRAPSRGFRSLFAERYRLNPTAPRHLCRLSTQSQQIPNLVLEVAVLPSRIPALTDELPQRLARITLSYLLSHGVSVVVRSGVADEQTNRHLSHKPCTSRSRDA